MVVRELLCGTEYLEVTAMINHANDKSDSLGWDFGWYLEIELG